MTVGIICLDGLDHRLASEHDVFEPVSVSGQPLVNNLDGENPLFTPRVWNSLFLGRDQREITDWVPESDWNDITEGWNYIWNTVVGTSLLNVNVHSHYLHQNACIPDGWTPAHGSWGMMVRSTEDLIGFWNETIEAFESTLQIGYWRLPDAYGHWASKKGLGSMESVYDWIRETFWQQIELPDDYLVLSDHGFVRDPSTGDGGREEHTEHAVVASTLELSRMKMAEFIDHWHDPVIRNVREGNLEDLGYV